MVDSLSPVPHIDLEGIGVLSAKSDSSTEEAMRAKEINPATLDRIFENQERADQSQFLLREEFELKEKQVLQMLKLQKIEFCWLLIAKIVLFVFVIALVSSIAYKLYCLFGKASISDLILLEKSHVLLAIVVGSFLTIFGLLASLLKGLGQKEKSDTPIAVEEVLKTLLSAFKSSK